MYILYYISICIVFFINVHLYLCTKIKIVLNDFNEKILNKQWMSTKYNSTNY